MKVIIIDDEPLARSIIKEYLQSYTAMEVVEECSDGFEGVKAIMQYQPDLIFLDVQMPKINGFEMLELVDQPPPVIFTTAFDEYAMKAFDSHAVDYLLKPFSKERFDKALQKLTEQKASGNNQQLLLEAAAQSPHQSQRIVVKIDGKIQIIPVQEIDYIEAADDYVKINTKKGAFLKNKTMSHFEQVLDGQQFVRTHRSFIINVGVINRIDPYEKDNHIAILQSGARIPVSKSGYARLKEILGL
jgi:two-component system, LytTR family, response regulator